jgi:hypothetical protein
MKGNAKGSDKVEATILKKYNDMKLDITKPVKLIHPEPGEEHLIFSVTNFNEVTQRCYIRPLNLEGCTKGLEPEELVSVDDLINVKTES